MANANTIKWEKGEGGLNLKGEEEYGEWNGMDDNSRSKMENE